MGIELFYPAPAVLPDPVSPHEADQSIRRRIEETDWRELVNLEDDRLVRAGALWLHGCLEPAHRIVQEIPSADGMYWHALVHRSEGDYHNSLYWFARLDTHSIFPDLRNKVEGLLDEGGQANSDEGVKHLLTDKQWNPRHFVELCRRVREGQFHDRDMLQRIAAAEYNLLMGNILGM